MNIKPQSQEILTFTFKIIGAATSVSSATIVINTLSTNLACFY